jgi:hypothetical protein
MVIELGAANAAAVGGPQSPPRRRPSRAGRLAVAMLVAGLAVAGCGVPGVGDLPGVTAYPTPTCGGARIGIEGALDCQTLAGLAIGTLAERLPDHLARGVVSIEATLGDCPFGEVPRQVECERGSLVQFVKVTFEPPVEGGPIEPHLTVAIEPVEGRVLGIVNPLILGPG